MKNKKEKNLFTIQEAEKIFICGGKLARNFNSSSFEEVIKKIIEERNNTKK